MTVVEGNFVTKLDIPVEKILQSAYYESLETVIVIGYDKDGEEYFASYIADGGTVLWLLERMKLQLLKAEVK